MSFLWQTHLSSGYEQQAEESIDINDIKYHQVRTDLISLIKREPKISLDVGCSLGATSKAIKDLYPNCYTIGIEIDPKLAELAKPNVDKILQKSIELVNCNEEEIPLNSIDTVILADVLEHIYNPWQTLVDLKKLLTKDAQVIASIPNVQFLGVITDLINGEFEYRNMGLLDITHVRFFTYKSILSLFEETGYTVTGYSPHIIESVEETFKHILSLPKEQKISVDFPNFSLRDITVEEFTKMCIFQYFIVATPNK